MESIFVTKEEPSFFSDIQFLIIRSVTQVYDIWAEINRQQQKVTSTEGNLQVMKEEEGEQGDHLPGSSPGVGQGIRRVDGVVGKKLIYLLI